ncbi:VTT domain-containing protein [Rhizobium sp. VS19-DR104.2]|uniref:DedA family protein n=1 Tax=unclassified Rhizobium TaxID=2613769 RepID=UPI001CC3CA18|nr:MULTISPECIES: VTT domain-containing protein [unclassified Rhizobium]MBZ5762942.1 VTT domain-containing protein [Rhizobium sp. VS19-DR96]MBZ5768775.1 VTT domain-containing protein [Rhizobium sp. VS19-DR129.2]MBZ5776391.1 VTT domain-containing protein [Rhizobium sp. VS19-DRK62.2]MBZ5787598.1 VTT domain-containing protein [Rhizobium sp. VS19-DR121]MBZ5804953.1 VTT domain-containing protein [Rhizobium sp. VS19-DR181]
MSIPDLLAIIVGFGVAGMFSASAFEKMVPIIPSYLMLLLFGSASDTVRDMIFAVVATVAGSVIGTACVYSLGRALGETRIRYAVDRYGSYILCPPERYRRLAAAYRKNHFLVSVCGQMIPVARLYLSIPAGVLKLRADRFLLASAIGIVAYNTTFLTAGFILRQEAFEPVTTGIILSAGLVGAEVAVAFGWRWIQSTRPPAY